VPMEERFPSIFIKYAMPGTVMILDATDDAGWPTV
jgi:hypothetical protein